MRVLVDTSAWVEFFNGQASAEARAVRELVEGDDDVCTCGVVVAEVLQGLRNERSRRQVQELFESMTLLEPTGLSPYVRAASLYRSLRGRGVTIRSTIDCLIAVLAEENGCALLSRDRDLSGILASGLVGVRSWS